METSENLETTKKIASHSYCSYEQDVDREFVNRFVADAIEILEPYRRGLLYICGYNPPWFAQPSIKGVDYQPGHITLTFAKSDAPDDDEFADLDIIFGYFEKGKFLRSGVDKDALKNLPGCCQTFAYNFDEAWQIICLIAEKLEVTQIRITCGGA